jgi:hypothetical protein
MRPDLAGMETFDLTAKIIDASVSDVLAALRNILWMSTLLLGWLKRLRPRPGLDA